MNPQRTQDMSDRETTAFGSTPAYNPSGTPNTFMPTVNTDQATPRPGQRPLDWGPPTPRAEGAATQIMPAFRSPPTFAWLVIVDSPDKRLIGEIFKLNAGSTSVGRAASNDITLPDNACSAQHAKVRVDQPEGGEKEFVIHDLASTNGTYVGGKDTYQEESSRTYHQVLHDSDYILLGETSLVFKRV